MTDSSKETREAAEERLCVICGLYPQSQKYHPFCSKRCADIDLHRWLGGVYAITGKPDDGEDEIPGGGTGPDDDGRG